MGARRGCDVTTRFGLPLGFLLTLALASFAQGQSPEAAAKPPFGSLAQLSTKGIVTAKGERSLAIRESGGGALHIAVTPHTKVSGLRTTFEQIAVSDVVRVDGSSVTASRVMTADHVTVIFAAEMTERARAKPANMLWALIKNGGVTVDLP